MANAKTQTPSNAYMRFESVVKRSLGMITAYEFMDQVLSHAVTTTQEKTDHSDIIRAAIVLAVAAMDSYFTNVFSEHLIEYIKKRGPTEKMANFLKDAGVDTKCALELLTMERPYRRIRSIVAKHLARKTMQKVEAINKLFEPYGIKDFCEAVQKATRRKQIISSLKILVLRRHKIVHEGDLNSHGRTRPVNVKDTKKRVQDILTFVSKSDEIIISQTR